MVAVVRLAQGLKVRADAAKLLGRHGPDGADDGGRGRTSSAAGGAAGEAEVSSALELYQLGLGENALVAGQELGACLTSSRKRRGAAIGAGAASSVKLFQRVNGSNLPWIHRLRCLTC